MSIIHFLSNSISFTAYLEGIKLSFTWFTILSTLIQQVLYTIGGLENLQTAKKYYASTITLTGGKNTRALYGVCLVRMFLII